MTNAYDELFNVTMTKAESAAAAEVWNYIQSNSIGMQVLETPKNTKTNLTVQEVLILEKNKSPHSTRRESLIVARRGAVPVLEIDENDIHLLDQTVHRIYSPNGYEVWVPTFEIACNPSLRFSAIIGNKSFTSKNILREASKALCTELDYQVLSLLIASLGEKNLVSEDCADFFLKNPAYDSLIVSRSFSEDKRISWTKKITNDDFQVMNAGYVVNALGKKIPVHFIASSEEGIMFLEKRSGDLIIDHEPYVIKNRDANKLRINLVIFFSVGLVAHSIGHYYKKITHNNLVTTNKN